MYCMHVSIFSLSFDTNKSYMFKHMIVLILPTITVALKIYYVLPDNGLVYNSATGKTAFTLTHYLKYGSKYITSNTQTKFLPGKLN